MLAESASCDLAGSCMIDQALVCQCRQGGRDETERRFGRGECTCCTNCIRVTSTQRVRIGGPARNGFVTSGILGPSIIAAEHGQRAATSDLGGEKTRVRSSMPCTHRMHVARIHNTCMCARVPHSASLVAWRGTAVAYAWFLFGVSTGAVYRLAEGGRVLVEI